MSCCKKKYLTEEAAEVVVGMVRKNKKHKKTKRHNTLNSYKYPHCGYWHIGHSKGLVVIK